MLVSQGEDLNQLQTVKDATKVIHHRDFTSISVLPVGQEHGENDRGSQRNRTVFQHTGKIGGNLGKGGGDRGKNFYQLNS